MRSRLHHICRLAFHVATGLSVLVLLGCAVFWTRSGRNLDGVYWVTPGHRTVYVESCDRRLHLGVAGFFSMYAPGLVWRSGERLNSFPFTRNWSYSGWNRVTSRFPFPGTDYHYFGVTFTWHPPGKWVGIVAIPYPYLLAFSAVLPGVWAGCRLYRRRKARRFSGFPVESVEIRKGSS